MVPDVLAVAHRVVEDAAGAEFAAPGDGVGGYVVDLLVGPLFAGVHQRQDVELVFGEVLEQVPLVHDLPAVFDGLHRGVAGIGDADDAGELPAVVGELAADQADVWRHFVALAMEGVGRGVESDEAAAGFDPGDQVRDAIGAHRGIAVAAEDALAGAAALGEVAGRVEDDDVEVGELGGVDQPCVLGRRDLETAVGSDLGQYGVDVAGMAVGALDRGVLEAGGLADEEDADGVVGFVFRGEGGRGREEQQGECEGEEQGTSEAGSVDHAGEVTTAQARRFAASRLMPAGAPAHPVGG